LQLSTINNLKVVLLKDFAFAGVLTRNVVGSGTISLSV